MVASAASAAPLEAFSRLPLIEEAQISPDGTMIAYAPTDGEKRLVVVRRVSDGRQTLREYPVDGGEPKVVTEKTYDGMIRDPATHRLVGLVALVGDDYRYTFFDPKADAAWASVTKACSGDRVHLASWSDDHRKIVVTVDSATLGRAYALVDFDKKSANWLGETFPGVKKSDISDVRSITYKAKDGLAINGYLTLPHGMEARNLPLVVLPHGGPAARDTPGFDWWAQALASYDALKKAGKPVERVTLKGEDHWLSRGDTRLQMLQAMVAFLEKHNPPN